MNHNLTSKQKRTPRQLIEIMASHVASIVRFVCRSRRSYVIEQDIEDISQEILLLLLKDDYRVLRSFDETRSSATTWLAGIAIRCVANYARRIRRTTVTALDEVTSDLLVNQPIQELNLLLLERREKLELISAQLTRRERELLVLVRRGRNNTDIAVEMSLSVCSVYTRKHSLIRKIRELVEPARSASPDNEKIHT